MEEGKISFYLSVEELKKSAGEDSISKCIVHFLRKGKT
jgi:hypothetical protein